MLNTAHIDAAAVRQAITTLRALEALLPLAPVPQAPPIGASGTHLRDRVLAHLRAHGRVSAPELQRVLVSDSVAIANALRDLARGLVVRTNEIAPKLSGRGRAPRYYRVVRAGRRATT